MSARDLHVVFGTAALGQAIMRRLVAAGQSVRMVSRSGALVSPGVGPVTPPPGVELLAADAADLTAARVASEGATVLYHTAAPDDARWTELYPQIQRGMIAAAAATGARLVSAEGIHAYGPVDGPITEDCPYAATTSRDQLRAAMSDQLMAAHAAGKIAAVIARAPDFYGPQATTTTVYGEHVFYPAIAGKKVTVMGALDLPHTFIYVDDFARGMITLGARPDAMGQVWHLPCAPTLTQRQLLTLIFETAGKQPNLAGSSAWLLKLAGPFAPAMRDRSDHLYQWDRPLRFDHSKYARAFGAPVTAHERAVAATVAWFQAHPQA